METILLWGFFIAGVVLSGVLSVKMSLKVGLLGFFIAAYFASFFGDLVVINHLISYPVKLLPAFKSSILYEYLLLPLLSVTYYLTTYRNDVYGCVWQAFIYSSILTLFEMILERNTDVVHYISWNWMFTLTSLFCFLLLIRSVLQLISRIKKKREGQ